jgi:hypothetical protein
MSFDAQFTQFTAGSVCYQATVYPQELISGHFIDSHAARVLVLPFENGRTFYSNFIQEFVLSDWTISSAHAQKGYLQMPSPAHLK